MKHFYVLYLLFLLLVLLMLSACDSGDVHEVYRRATTGRTALLTGPVDEWEELPEGYNLALAAFGSSSQYALGQRILSSSDVENGRLRVALSELSDTVHTVELCVTNTLRKKVMSLQRQEMASQPPQDTVRLESALRALTEGHSMAMLVNVPAASHPELLRVSGGNPEESLLHRILAESGQDVLHVNHVEILHKLGVDTDVLRTFIDAWIKSLPPKDPNS